MVCFYQEVHDYKCCPASDFVDKMALFFSKFILLPIFSNFLPKQLHLCRFFFVVCSDFFSVILTSFKIILNKKSCLLVTTKCNNETQILLQKFWYSLSLYQYNGYSVMRSKDEVDLTLTFACHTSIWIVILVSSLSNFLIFAFN